jgi:predicted PhzF superfamily epimerase YddE/YHI9
MNETTAEDRCRAVLLGQAAGDRIGGPIRLAVRLAESLIACVSFNLQDILERYVRRWREGAFDSTSSDPRFDFLSPFFAPASGVDEDPVTGSAFQASARRGVVKVRVAKDRALLGGKAITVARGELLVGEDEP